MKTRLTLKPGQSVKAAGGMWLPERKLWQLNVSSWPWVWATGSSDDASTGVYTGEMRVRRCVYVEA